MTQETTGSFRPGETGLIVTVPEAEAVVGSWRRQFDAATLAGIPAHITVLYPFLDRHRLDAGVRAELAALFGSREAFDVDLRECRRFPGVLYLAPEPGTGLRALTRAVAARWPEAPPYGGQFADVVPHLTIAHQQAPEILDAVERDVSARLPISARVASVHLMVCTGDRWHDEQTFPLAAG